jgi:TRAP-type mannitol/chloroaromatic compound transport system substrate-binding protein
MKITNLAIASVITASITATSSLAEDKNILLKVPTAFSTNLVGLGTPLPVFKEVVESMSSTIKVKIYEPDKLIAPFEILDAVSDGKVNAGWSYAGYWKGKLPSAAIFSAVPFGPEAPEFIAWMYKGNGLKLYQKMYDDAKYNVHVLPCSISSPETAGWFKKEINGPEDFNGLKMRFAGLGGDVLTKLGTSVSLLPGGELFSGLEKGVIDATEFSMPVVDQRMGFSKIAKYNYFPGWHQQATFFELLINKETWNSMSTQQQSVVATTCQANITDSLAESEAIQGAVIKKNIEERGVIVKKLSPETLTALRGAWNEALVDLKKDPGFDLVWKDLEEFRASYKYWNDLAFLPKN